MSSYKVESQYTNFPVCQLTINGITRCRNSGMAHYFKTTSCCGELKAVHHKCAIRFSSKIDSTYKFCTLTYEGDSKIKSLCMNCSVIFSIVTINVTAL